MRRAMSQRKGRFIVRSLIASGLVVGAGMTAFSIARRLGRARLVSRDERSDISEQRMEEMFVAESEGAGATR